MGLVSLHYVSLEKEIGNTFTSWSFFHYPCFAQRWHRLAPRPTPPVLHAVNRIYFDRPVKWCGGQQRHNNLLSHHVTLFQILYIWDVTQQTPHNLAGWQWTGRCSLTVTGNGEPVVLVLIIFTALPISIERRDQAPVITSVWCLGGASSRLPWPGEAGTVFPQSEQCDGEGEQHCISSASGDQWPPSHPLPQSVPGLCSASA